MLIATDSHADPTFRELQAPLHDVAALREVLADEHIGDFTVAVAENTPVRDLRVEIERFFSRAERDDLLLLYFSGHGVKDENGDLHLVATDTERDLLESTGIGAAFVRRLIDRSPARRVVLWLDCCYGGAFPPGATPKAASRVDVFDQLAGRSGRGCAVMTASTHLGYAYETREGRAPSGSPEPSVFTRVIAEGLRTGEADLGGDGLVDVAELYTYVHDRVRAIAPAQAPTRNDQLTGDVYIARNPAPRRPEEPAPVAEVPARGRRRYVVAFGGVSVVAVAVAVFLANLPDDQRGAATTPPPPTSPVTTSGSAEPSGVPHLKYASGDEPAYPYTWAPLDVPAQFQGEERADAKAWWKLRGARTLHTEFRIDPYYLVPTIKFRVGGAFYPNASCGPIRVEAGVGTRRVSEVVEASSDTLQLPNDLPAIGTNDTFVVDIRVVRSVAGCEGELRWEHITLTRVP
nr:caspase family protein [Amycolatopsis sp. SID8362]